MNPQYFNFPTFSTYFVGSECRFLRNRWLPVPISPATALYLCCGACRCGVTGVTCTVCNALKTRRSERNACVRKWKPDETGRMWLMNCTCNCVAFIQMVTHNLSNLRPFPVYGQHIPSHSQLFPWFQRDVSLTGWQHSAANPESRVCVCVSEAPVFTWNLLRLSQPVLSFLGNVSQTAWQHCDPCFSHGQLNIACSRVGNPTNIYIPAPEGNTKNSSNISNKR